MFSKVQTNITKGDTYLLNLTVPTILTDKLNLQHIYDISNSKFKLLYKDQFVCFSPEKFVDIKDGKIYTYPMKGTIDASITNAKTKLLNDPKELAEHTMVVDLLRNDISKVAKRTTVDKFRYIDKIASVDKTLLQTSSQISGELSKNWKENFGCIVDSLLPAGSISGTPKLSTTKLIQSIETRNRGYYTGVFGIYQNNSFESYVLIRYIRKDKNDLYIYESGGGITHKSDVFCEYKELNDKIYIP
jgi:para-aminobenzoate synthetase component 1